MENATQLSTTLPSARSSTINPSSNPNPSSHANTNIKSESGPLSSSPQNTSQKPIKENPTEDPPMDKEENPEVRLEEPESVRTSRPLIVQSPIIAEHEIHKSPSMNTYFSSQTVEREGKTSHIIGKIKIDSKPNETDLVQRRSSNREDSYREDPPVDQKRSSMKKKKSLVDGIRVDESNEVPISANTEVVRESVHTMIRHDNKPKEEAHGTNNQQTTTAPDRESDVALEVRRNTQIREPEEEDDSVSEYSDDDDDDDNQGQAGNQRQEDPADNLPAPQPIQLNPADVMNAMAAINRENNNRIIRNDIALKLRLSMALFFFGFLGSSFLRSSLQDNEVPQNSFIVLYVFFFWVMFERSYRFKYEFFHNWQKRDTLFDILDVFGFGLFILLLNLKVTGHIGEMSNIFLYPLALCVFYIFFSQAPKGTKESRVLFRLIITVQVLLLARKIDDNLDWDWLLSIILIMVYLGMIALYCLLLATTFMFMLLFLMCGLSIYGNLDRTVQFMGVKWNLIFTSLSIVVIVLCVGASQGTENGTEMLLNSLRALEIMGIYMTAYTGIFFSQIATFMFYFATEENQRNARIGLQAQATISMQKAKTYFVMLSSTYFIELKNSFVIKDKNKLGKMKATLENAKAKKNTPKFIKKIQDLLVKLPEGLQARMENFKKDKEIFDKHFTGKELKAKNKCEEHNKHNLSEPHINKGLNDGVSLDNKTNQKYKVWLSEGDDVGFACVDLNESQKDENSGLCYICFTNEANSIMVDCGHGGVCYNCAAEFLKRKGQCMECRAKVTQVAKVKIEKGFKNILIGDEVGKLT